MNFNFITYIQACYDFVNYDAPLTLVYYSHISTVVISLLIGFFVLKNNPKLLLGRALFALSIFFSLWVILDLLIWIGYSSINIMFVWSFLSLLGVLIYLSCVYFAYLFINKKNIPFWITSVFSIILLPVIFFTATTYNLESFYIPDCIANEGNIFTNYAYFVGAFSALWILSLSIFGCVKNKDKTFRKQTLLLTIGLEAFILTFFSSGFIDTYLVDNGITGDYLAGNYGLFGMTIFMGLLAYLIVQFKTFNVKLIGANALVVTLWILIGSLLFAVQSTTALVIAAITLLMSVIFGYYLIRSVRNEVQTREYAQGLAKALADSNDKLFGLNSKLKELDRQKTEFVSIASHQLRTPLTAIKGYSSMLLEGSFGELTEKPKNAVEVIYQSSNRLVNVIEDFLNITRIELGKMKYDMTVIDIAEMMKVLEGELTPFAKRRKIDFSIKLESAHFHTYADYGKLSQVVSNVIDNAIKYTPEGSVHVTVSRPKNDSKNIHVVVKDTGVGIAAESIPKLFQKFIRADEVGKTHISGTGLGLYVAKQIIDAHKGDIRIESNGVVGKGSTFTITIPVYEGEIPKK